MPAKILVLVDFDRGVVIENLDGAHVVVHRDLLCAGPRVRLPPFIFVFARRLVAILIVREVTNSAGEVVATGEILVDVQIHASPGECRCCPEQQSEKDDRQHTVFHSRLLTVEGDGGC